MKLTFAFFKVKAFFDHRGNRELLVKIKNDRYKHYTIGDVVYLRYRGSSTSYATWKTKVFKKL